MRFILLLVGIFLYNLSFAQVADQDKMNYQAVIFNASNNIVVSSNVGVKVSLLQTSVNGTAVYVETHTVMTNENGLLILEIGGGTVVSGNYDSIDWAVSPYFLKIETDPEGGTNYAISSTQKLMSVPFALYAKSVNETDPVFSSSTAAAITGSDTANWNSKLDTFIEADPSFSTSVAAGITGTDTAFWNSKQNELIPGPGFLISNDSLKMNQKHYVGEYFGGGVVAYVTPDGEHGLILAYKDLPNGESYQFSNITTEAAFTSYNDGTYSTSQIINQAGHTASAAKACDDWTNTEYLGTGTYDDWYLPSAQEVIAICYANPFLLMEAYLNDGSDDTTWFTLSEDYWTSSEAIDVDDGGITLAYKYQLGNSIVFTDNTISLSYKHFTFNIRCVRKF